jgi:methyl-accepting chemotaxis protein
MNSQLLTIFIAVTSIAVVLQVIILFAFYLSVRKVGERVTALSDKVEQDVIPGVVQVRELVTKHTENVNAIVKNVLETTTAVREQAERVSLTLNDVIDRTRLQVIRADEMVTRTFDRVEQTAENVQHTVLSPVRKFSAVLSGIVAGIGEYSAGRKVRHAENAVPREEMFI